MLGGRQAVEDLARSEEARWRLGSEGRAREICGSHRGAFALRRACAHWRVLDTRKRACSGRVKCAEVRRRHAGRHACLLWEQLDLKPGPSSIDFSPHPPLQISMAVFEPVGQWSDLQARPDASPFSHSLRADQTAMICNTELARYAHASLRQYTV